MRIWTNILINFRNNKNNLHTHLKVYSRKILLSTLLSFLLLAWVHSKWLMSSIVTPGRIQGFLHSSWSSGARVTCRNSFVCFVYFQFLTILSKVSKQRESHCEAYMVLHFMLTSVYTHSYDILMIDSLWLHAVRNLKLECTIQIVPTKCGRHLNVNLSIFSS
jgi:hypothetical protein